MIIEKLTEDEIENLEQAAIDGYPYTFKALRIIDQLTADFEEEQQKVLSLREENLSITRLNALAARVAHDTEQALHEEKTVSKHWIEQHQELHKEVARLQLENDDMRNEPYTRAKTAEARIEKAIHWLVTCRYDVPANILADRARLALEALRGK